MEAALNPDLPQDREKLRRLFRIKRVEGEMMKERGYTLSEVYLMTSNMDFRVVNLLGLQDPNLPLESLLQFRQQQGLFQSRQEFSGVYFDRERNRQIIVLYLGNDPGKAVGKKFFKLALDFIKTGVYHDIILITETGLNPDASNTIRQCVGYNIEVFKDSELAFNIRKHALAPIFSNCISSNDVRDWSMEEGITQPEKLPMILDSDPIAKRFGAKPSDVFQHELLGTEYDKLGFYRIVRQTPIERKTVTKTIIPKRGRCAASKAHLV